MRITSGEYLLSVGGGSSIGRRKIHEFFYMRDSRLDRMDAKQAVVTDRFLAYEAVTPEVRHISSFAYYMCSLTVRRKHIFFFFYYVVFIILFYYILFFFCRCFQVLLHLYYHTEQHKILRFAVANTLTDTWLKNYFENNTWANTLTELNIKLMILKIILNFFLI